MRPEIEGLGGPFLNVRGSHVVPSSPDFGVNWVCGGVFISQVAGVGVLGIA
jgi:hypothetical protein